MTSLELERVTGPNLALRLIRPDDAEYVYGLRSDTRYNTHLSSITGTNASTDGSRRCCNRTISAPVRSWKPRCTAMCCSTTSSCRSQP